MEPFVDRRALLRSSTVEPSRAFVEQRWAEGCTEVKARWEAVQARGFQGTYKRVWHVTRGWHPPVLPVAATPALMQPHQETRTPRPAMWLLLRHHDAWETAEAADRTVLEQICPEVERAAALAGAFGQLMRARQGDARDAWLAEVDACGMREWRRFAMGVRQDYAAVRAAFDHAWSQGQTEGQVTRLKVLKRMMFGRATFDLLRLRVLYGT